MTRSLGLDAMPAANTFTKFLVKLNLLHTAAVSYLYRYGKQPASHKNK